MTGPKSGKCSIGSSPNRRAKVRMFGIEAFIREDGGSTSIAMGVAILVSLCLVFSLASVSWVSSRAADVQAVADAGALAAANILSAYATVAQMLDAIALSLGLIGMLTLAIGIVLCAIPLVNAVGPPVIEAATKVFDARSSFTSHCAVGLSKLEEAVPYLMATNSVLAIRANASNSGNYGGIAVPFPAQGSSDFGPLLTSDGVGDKARQSKESGDRIDEITSQAKQAQERANDALERGWRADCGPGMSLRERAETLAGLGGVDNPNYTSTAGWGFEVPLARARAYYAQRLAAEVYGGDDPLDMSRSAARAAFYEYALSEVQQSSCVHNEDGSVTCDLHWLPKNTEEVKATELYDDVRWPVSIEGSQKVVHSDARCPGNTAGISSYASLRQLDDDSHYIMCSDCQFSIIDIGRAPSASTNIDNGFEYYWQEIVEASQEYASAKNEQVEKERQAQQEAQNARDLFKEALEKVGATRVKLSPPGRYGCVCVVADTRSHYSPQQLSAFVGVSAELPPRVAVSAATVARDASTKGNNVFAGFFDGLVSSNSVAVGVGGRILDAVMTGWGDLLVGYGNGYQAFVSGAHDWFAKLERIGLDGVAGWLRSALDAAIELTDLEPADMSAKKPVLVDTNDVMRMSQNSWYQAVHALVMAAPALQDAHDISSMMTALGVYTQTLTGTDEIVITQFTIPGTTKSIPIKIDFGWLAQVTASL